MRLSEFKINKPKASDTMGITRDKMPQVKQDDYQEYKTYLKDNGVTLRPEVVDAKSLKPMQKEFSDQGVAKQLNRNKEKGEGMNPKPLLASSDGYIIDGHHRWLAAVNSGFKVNILRANVDAQELLSLTLKFPRVYFKDIYTEDDEQMDIITKAEQFAQEAHKDHKRKYTGDPYYVHLDEVRNIVKQAGGTIEQQAAALLHDTVEDTNTTPMDITREFGPKIAKLVVELTDVSKPEDGNRKTRKAIDRDKLAGVSAEAQTVKYADLISNGKDIAQNDPKFAKVYHAEKADLLRVMKKGNQNLRKQAIALLPDELKSVANESKGYFTRTKSQSSKGKTLLRTVKPDLEKTLKDIKHKLEPDSSGNRIIITVDKSDVDKVRKLVGLPNLTKVVSEEGPFGVISRKLGHVINKKAYINMAQMMHKILKRKYKETGGKIRHGLGYYAMMLAMQTNNKINWRELEKEYLNLYGNELFESRARKGRQTPQELEIMKLYNHLLTLEKGSEEYENLRNFINRKLKADGKQTLDEDIESYTNPNFNVEWDEATRYPEFKKIGKDKWIELAKSGKAIDVDNALSNKIENTEAGEENRHHFDKLEEPKKERFRKAVKAGKVELPIIARYSDGYLELVAGNTRLTGMMNEFGKGKAWIFDVPDEVAELGEGGAAITFNMFNESGEINNKVFKEWYNNYYKPVRDKFPNRVAGQLKKYGYDPYNRADIRQFVKNNPKWIDSIRPMAKQFANAPDWQVKMGGSMAGLSNDQSDFAINMRNKLKKERPDVWKDVSQGNLKGALNKLGIKTEQINKEGWSDKYKKSINCSNPKGFSQKAHCAGRKKKESVNEEALNVKPIITPAIKKLDKIFKANDYEVRIVGGAVRDIALGKEPKDIDFATDATPDEMMNMLDKAKVKTVPTGIEHGTITAVIDDEPFEITTLRADKETDGRRAEVEFVRSWEEDAKRRDLTYNAMSMDIDGNIYDYNGGMDDLQDKVSKFVGDPAERIKEDYLRILRYFRFQSKLDNPKWDEDTLKAIKDNADGIKGISVERIWQEMSKLLMSSNAEESLEWMNKTGVNELIGLGGIKPSKLGEPVGPIVSLAILLDNSNIARQWKMSKYDTEMLDFLIKHKGQNIDIKQAKDMLVKGVSQDHLLAWANMHNKNDVYDAVHSFEKPEFPVNGQDLLAMGYKAGPNLGQLLSDLQDQWMKSNYKLSKEELLNKVPVQESIVLEKVSRFMTGHGITYKGKKHDEMEVEVVGVDNVNRKYQVMILRPEEHFGTNVMMNARFMHRGPWVKTKIPDYMGAFAKSDVKEWIYPAIQGAAHLARTYGPKIASKLMSDPGYKIAGGLTSGGGAAYGAYNYVKDKFDKKKKKQTKSSDGPSIPPAEMTEAENSTPEVYVDMDGVLVDFFTEWAKLMKVKTYRDIPKRDIPKALKKIVNTPNFWEDLPALAGYKELLSTIKKLKGKYKILSSPLANDPNVDPGKREWVRRNLGFFKPEQVIIDHNKQKYATQSDGTPNLLIDDFGKNVKAWQSAGGIAIKHHTSTTNDTVNAINKVFSNTVNETGGVGRVVPGINTTVDVGPNEIIKQAKKFGNDVNKDGFPKKLLRTKKK